MSGTRLMLALLISCLLAVPAAQADAIHFRAGGGAGYTDVAFDDTYIDPNNGSSTYGTSTTIISSSTRVALIAVKDLFSELPGTSGGLEIDILSASLYLTRYNQGTTSTIVSIYRCTTDWLPDSAGSNENDVCYDYAEKSASTQWASGDFSSSDYDGGDSNTDNWVSGYNEQCELDLTDVIAGIYESDVNYGLAIKASGIISCRSSERSTLSDRPSLKITYEYVPEPATLSLLVLGGLVIAKRRRR